MLNLAYPRRPITQAVLVRQCQPLWHQCTFPQRYRKSRPLNPAFLHHFAVVEMGEQHIKCRKVPAPKPKFHPLLQVDFPWLAHANPRDFQRYLGTTQISSTMRFETVFTSPGWRRGKREWGNGCYPIKHIPQELRSEASGKTHSHDSILATSKNNGLKTRCAQPFWKSIAPIRTSAHKNKYTSNFTFNFRGVHRHMLPTTYNKPMDPRFKPWPTIRQAKTGLEVVMLLSSLSSSSLATDHVSGPFWSSETVTYLAKGKKWTQPQFQMQGWGEQGIAHSRRAHRNSEEASRKVNQIWCDLRLLQIRP